MNQVHHFKGVYYPGAATFDAALDYGTLHDDIRGTFIGHKLVWLSENPEPIPSVDSLTEYDPERTSIALDQLRQSKEPLNIILTIKRYRGNPRVYKLSSLGTGLVVQPDGNFLMLALIQDTVVHYGDDVPAISTKTDNVSLDPRDNDDLIIIPTTHKYLSKIPGTSDSNQLLKYATTINSGFAFSIESRLMLRFLVKCISAIRNAPDQRTVINEGVHIRVHSRYRYLVPLSSTGSRTAIAIHTRHLNLQNSDKATIQLNRANLVVYWLYHHVQKFRVLPTLSFSSVSDERFSAITSAFFTATSAWGPVSDTHNLAAAILDMTTDIIFTDVTGGNQIALPYLFNPEGS